LIAIAVSSQTHRAYQPDKAVEIPSMVLKAVTNRSLTVSATTAVEVPAHPAASQPPSPRREEAVWR
jgi:hypothetical protein